MVYLAQTDTTVGFLSVDDKVLAKIKCRDTKQKTLQVVDSLQSLTKIIRVPSKRKKQIRRSKKTTYIYPNGLSFRVVEKDHLHNNFIKKFSCLYSTSANKTRENFNEKFALNSVDIIVYAKDGFYQSESSTIYKINKTKIKRIR